MASIPASSQQSATLPCHRSRNLAQLLGISDAEAKDYSLSGRVHIILKLKGARSREITRGQAGSWLYDISRHLSLCAALRMECEAFAEYLLEQKREHLEALDEDDAAPIGEVPAVHIAAPEQS